MSLAHLHAKAFAAFMSVLRGHSVSVSPCNDSAICRYKVCTLVAGVNKVSMAIGEQWQSDGAKKEMHSELGMSFNPEVWDLTTTH